MNHAPSPADLAQRTPAPAGQPVRPPRPAPARRKPKPKPKAQLPIPVPYVPQVLSPAEAIAPGELRTNERFKPTFQRGLLISGMLPEARLMGYTLVWYADHITGRISPHLQPDAAQLAASSGLSEVRVGVQLEVLRERGWLHINRISEGPRVGGPRFDLAIPALYLERIRVDRTAHAIRVAEAQAAATPDASAT